MTMSVTELFEQRRVVKCALFAQRFRCGRAVLCEDTLSTEPELTIKGSEFSFVATAFYAVIAADVAGIDADFIHARRCGPQAQAYNRNEYPPRAEWKSSL